MNSSPPDLVLQCVTDTLPTTERPFHLAIGILLLSGIFWTAFALYSKDTKQRYGSANGVLPVPRFEGSFLQEPAQSNIKKVADYVLRLCRQHVFSARMVACVVLRVIVLRSILHDVQCAWGGIEVFTSRMFVIDTTDTTLDFSPSHPLHLRSHQR